jgi:hypothetical protein
MGIEWFRDLVICISGLVITVVVIFVAVLAFLLYKGVQPILNSLKVTTATVQEITSTVKDEVIKPISQLGALIRGIAEGIQLAAKFFKKKEQEGGCNG